MMNNGWDKSLEYYNSFDVIPDLRKQHASLISRVIDIDGLERVEIIETGASQNFDDGCFGLFLAHAAREKHGKFFSVDVDEEILGKSSSMYMKNLDNYDGINSFLSDSVSFLEQYEGRPTIVHLDSWDLDIYNPEPSMLHGFLEFVAIKDKMDTGSYIIVDDNFIRGTFIFWNVYYDGELVKSEEYKVEQEILGKGSMIYHYCKRYDSEWEIIVDMFEEGPLRWKNQKLILRKK